MARTTIDYGIDLGTTNSSIAVLTDTLAEVVPNKDGSLMTPSAIWYDKRSKLYVGKDAKTRHLDDEENAAVEFKLRMGQDWRKPFKRSGNLMLPEEMSAEVLKSLKADVHTNKGEDLHAAVITVPAAFELPQCEATRRAATLAGLTVSPLLQEPVAAALAYGFQSASNKVFWLVYDFGGGTFDAAVIQVRDGVIQVVNHAGDNYLGGKNIDWDIVEKLLVPQLTAERRLPDFNRTNPQWRAAFAKLKYHSEEAKIQVSRTKQPVELWIEDLCADDAGDSIDFEFVLTPSALDAILEPWIEQSLSLCRKALSEKGLSGGDIEKVIFVGGSSLFPSVQERVATDLGTAVEFSIDPITVVARGAAVFAGSQRLEAPAQPATAGTYSLQLEYEPVGSDTEPMVGGKVSSPAGASAAGLRVEIVDVRSQWRSGTIALAENGTFMTEVHAEKGRKCEYEIILSDATGKRLPCSPDRFAYTVGMVITSPPLTHNLGVAMANNKPLWFFRKGDALPGRKQHVLYTAVHLRRGETAGNDNVIRIPIVEGTNDGKADRNRLIGHLEIQPDDKRVKRDIPLGSEIEVSIEIDTSRTTTTRAFIPIVDEEFKDVFKPGVVAKSPKELEGEFDAELKRLDSLRAKADDVADRKIHNALSRIEGEQIIETVQRQVAAAQGDPDAQGEADRRLLDLKAAVDSVEGAMEWPSLVQEAKEQVRDTREVVEAHGQQGEKDRLNKLAAEVEKAIEAERLELLQARLEDLRELGAGVVVRQPDFWVGYLQYLEERRSHMRDQPAADRLFMQAQRAITGNDFEALKAAVRQLIGLLPADEREAAEARGRFGGTIVSG